MHTARIQKRHSTAIIISLGLAFFSSPILAQAPISSIEQVVTKPVEGDSNHINYFLLQLNPANTETVTLSYATKDISAIAGEDYIPIKGSLSIPANTSSINIGVEIIGDNQFEGDESFKLVLSQPSGGKFPGYAPTLSATRTIIDDDFNQLPLAQINDLEYQGAFRLPAGTFGESRSAYSDGKIAYNKDNHSLFVSGFNHHGAVAEFPIPSLSTANKVENLNISLAPIQNYQRILVKPSLSPYGQGQSEKIDRIGALEYFQGSLWVQAYEYYDASASNMATSLVIESAHAIASSAIQGYLNLQGGAHTVLWLSPIPKAYQDLLGGDYIAGASNAFPINSRASMGPSAFVFNADDYQNASKDKPNIASTTLLDYDLEHILFPANKANSGFDIWQQSYQYNYSGDKLSGKDFAQHYQPNLVGDNAMWTEDSQAFYGLILENTRTYAVFGKSGMHQSGGGYKIEQKDGSICAGPCAYDPSDYQNYYWFYDIKDLMAVKRGEKSAYELKPYAYGEFKTPFDRVYNPHTQHYQQAFIGGGTYNAKDKLIYFSFPSGDRIQNAYEATPIIVAYSLK